MPPVNEFNPHSMDAQIATVIARLDADARSREEFRQEVRARFDRGAERMDELATDIAEVKAQTTKTNGRVTRLENSSKLLAAKAVAAVAAAALMWKLFVWMHANGLTPL